jgi:transcription antitermination factor NusG
MAADFTLNDVETKHPERWFALRVKPHRERVVASAARHKGFEEFLPLCKCRHRWSDRSKILELPLFPGYVFCRLCEEDRFALLTIPGVVHLVSNGRVPMPIDDQEISAIQTAVRPDIPAEPWIFLEVGERVKLSRGPLAGLEGFLVQADDRQRLVVGLTVLKRSIAVEVERDWIEHLDPAGRSPDAVDCSASGG